MPLRGDICLVEYPFTDSAAAKLRPALVAQGFGPFLLALTDAHQSPAGQYAIFLPITSKVSEDEFNVVIAADGPWFQATGLKVSSTALCWNINTIHKGFITRTVGRADPALMAEVEEKLRRVLNL